MIKKREQWETPSHWTYSNEITQPIALSCRRLVSSRQDDNRVNCKPLEPSWHVTSQKALQPLLHPTHFFQVQRDRIDDFRNIYIPDELELQSLKTLVVVIVGIWETGNTVRQ